MENMEELHRELMISQKNDELTPEAKNMLVDYTKKVFDEIFAEQNGLTEIHFSQSA